MTPKEKLKNNNLVVSAPSMNTVIKNIGGE